MDLQIRNGEYCLDRCPSVNAGPGHFYLNESKEIFYCQKCGERGHILSLKKRLGDLPAVSHIVSQVIPNPIPHPRPSTFRLSRNIIRDLLDNPAALSYLTDERAFSLETVKNSNSDSKMGQ